MLCKLKGMFTCSSSSRSTRSMSSRAGCDMNIDEPAAGAAAAQEGDFLMDEKDISCRGRQEKDKYKLLKSRTFTLTSLYSPQLLQDTGMVVEFDFTLHVVGWQNF